jgi:hypothetical protein
MTLGSVERSQPISVPIAIKQIQTLRLSNTGAIPGRCHERAPFPNAPFEGYCVARRMPGKDKLRRRVAATSFSDCLRQESLVVIDYEPEM